MSAAWEVVTPPPDEQSRNGRDLRYELTCRGGQIPCRGHFGMFDCFPHCVRCHTDDHNACIVCGACMGRSGDIWLPKYPSRNETRTDRFYCSNACRQKAYRERKKASR